MLEIRLGLESYFVFTQFQKLEDSVFFIYITHFVKSSLKEIYQDKNLFSNLLENKKPINQFKIYQLIFF